MWEKPLGGPMWQPAFTFVNGRLTRCVLEEAPQRDAWVSALDICAATELQTAKAGPLKFNLDTSEGDLWIDSRISGGAGASVTELSTGTHCVLV